MLVFLNLSHNVIQDKENKAFEAPSKYQIPKFWKDLSIYGSLKLSVLQITEKDA